MNLQTDLAKYLHRLLYEYSTVTIPNLGTISTRYASARIDKDRQWVTPPVKTVEFDETAQTNDGVLASHIARSERLPVADVENALHTYVEQLKAQLAAAQTVPFDDIGTLQVDENGKLQLISRRPRQFCARNLWFDAR